MERRRHSKDTCRKCGSQQNWMSATLICVAVFSAVARSAQIYRRARSSRRLWPYLEPVLPSTGAIRRECKNIHAIFAARFEDKYGWNFRREPHRLLPFECVCVTVYAWRMSNEWLRHWAHLVKCRNCVRIQFQCFKIQFISVKSTELLFCKERIRRWPIALLPIRFFLHYFASCVSLLCFI